MRGSVSKYIYMMVTKDEYELPLCVGTAKEVAEYAETTPANKCYGYGLQL